MRPGGMAATVRRAITFSCEGATLFGTIDEAAGATGLLIVSGGNEIRIGAHRGMAWLAAELAEAGHPVFRYDRRGVGDSEGDNGGFESARADLAAAVVAFRHAQPALRRVVGFGNCDGAATLALWGFDSGIDALALANPWVVEAESGAPAPAAIRARYADRLRDPAEWRRLLTGGVDLAKLASGLARALRPRPPGDLASRVAAGVSARPDAVTVFLAERDNTAIAYIDACKFKAFAPLREKGSEYRLASGSHSFASAEDKLWLRERLLGALG